MTAEEMFEKLGYEKGVYKESLYYIKGDENSAKTIITFNKGIVIIQTTFKEVVCITALKDEELRAINKQLEELQDQEE